MYTGDADVSSSATCSENEGGPASEEANPPTGTSSGRERRQSAKSAVPLSKRLARKLE